MAYRIKGIQSWDFVDKNGKRVVGSKLFVEHDPAKQGTVGSSYEEFKLLPNVKELLVQAFGNESECLEATIEDFTYDRFGRVNGFKF